MKEFKDKVIVVTGGGRGIGRAMAIEGAKRGMKCVINDIDGPAARSVVEEIKAMGAEAVAQEADISLYENIEALLKLTWIPSVASTSSATMQAAQSPARSGSSPNRISTGSPN